VTHAHVIMQLKQVIRQLLRRPQQRGRSDGDDLGAK
jgi:hypothetical protein